MSHLENFGCNHDTKILKSDIHPLGILCSEGDDTHVESGKWCWNRISVEKEILEGFTDYLFDEQEFL